MGEGGHEAEHESEAVKERRRTADDIGIVQFEIVADESAVVDDIAIVDVNMETYTPRDVCDTYMLVSMAAFGAPVVPVNDR